MRRRFGLFVTGVFASVLLEKVARAEPPQTASVKPPAVESKGTDPLVRAALVTPSFAGEAVRAALRAAGFPEERARLTSMALRTKSAAGLPEVWLRAARTTDDSLRLAPTATDPASYSELGGTGLWLEARLVWHLDRLVFDRDEVQVEHLRGDVAAAAVKLTNKVLEALFTWQRAALRAEDPKLSPEDNQSAVLTRAEMEVVLDVLTNGWFRTRIPGRPPSES